MIFRILKNSVRVILLSLILVIGLIANANAVYCVAADYMSAGGSGVVGSAGSVLPIFFSLTGTCPATAGALLTQNEYGASVAQNAALSASVSSSASLLVSHTASIAATSSQYSSLALRVAVLEGVSAPSASPFQLDPQQAGTVFFLFLGIPLVLFVSARGLGTMMNMVRGRGRH